MIYYLNILYLFSISKKFMCSCKISSWKWKRSFQPLYALLWKHDCNYLKWNKSCELYSKDKYRALLLSFASGESTCLSKDSFKSFTRFYEMNSIGRMFSLQLYCWDTCFTQNSTILWVLYWFIPIGLDLLSSRDLLKLS